MIQQQQLHRQVMFNLQVQFKDIMVVEVDNVQTMDQEEVVELLLLE
jgi:hypothetical protein